MIQYNSLDMNDKTSLVKPGDKIILNKYCEMFPDGVFTRGQDYEIETIEENQHFPLNSVVKLKEYTPILGLGWATFTDETENRVRERFGVEMQKRKDEGMTHERITGWDCYERFKKKLSQIEDINFELRFGDSVKINLDSLSKFKGDNKRISVLNTSVSVIVNMNNGLYLHPACLMYPENYAEVIHNRKIVQ